MLGHGIYCLQKRDEASREPPIDRSTDSGGHWLNRGRSKSPQPPKKSAFTGDPNKLA